MALFIGKHGQTIDAIQYLANAIARARGGDTRGGRRRGRVPSPPNGDARGIAVETRSERVAATGRRVELEPMTPVERKIVHEALKDDPEVETTSEGSEPNRYVVVLAAPLAD